MADDDKQEAPEAPPEETPDTVTEPSAQEPQAEPPAVEQAESSTEQQQEPAAEEQPVSAVAGDDSAEVAAADAAASAGAPQEAESASSGEAGDDGEEEPAPRGKPSVPGAHLEVDIVPEGVDPLGPSEAYEDPYALEDEDAEQAPKSEEDEAEEGLVEPISTAAIDLASGARYRATGKRKTAIARVTLRPGTGTYLVNGRVLEEHFPRVTLQRNIRQPLETVGYQERMDVIARLHGGGISAQAGALRHGVSRALLEADPNLRGELKRRGFLTRDSRAKERKKAGLKKARKRPQFSKR
jgi:small subunit ribosomal protein S9